ncbi:MAG TPA: cytochrome c [Bacillales bacterium]|nr:cytochrome c [Bacillales bacterium]
MKTLKMIGIAAALTVGLAACGGGGGNNAGNGNTGSGSASGSQGSSASSAGAKAIFEKNCASCHGKNLQGKVGPNLQHIGKEMSKKQILTQIKNGGGGMPAHVIKGQKAEKVATWLASKK